MKLSDDERKALADECAAASADIWKIMPPDNALRRRIVAASKTLEYAAAALRDPASLPTREQIAEAVVLQRLGPTMGPRYPQSIDSRIADAVLALFQPAAEAAGDE